MQKRPLRRWIARAFLWMTGWQADGTRPAAPRFVLIAAPHTTNWDFVYLLAFAALFEMEISWMGKSSLFRPPLGRLMRALGGIPIDRRRRGRVVDAMAAAFAEREALALVVPAEGTRDYVDYWKSGFYHIARAARVPIVLSFLDYGRKRGGFGPVLEPTGDLARDMDRIRAFYRDKQGKHPALFGRIRLREEDAPGVGEVDTALVPGASVPAVAETGALAAGDSAPGGLVLSVIHEDR